MAPVTYRKTGWQCSFFVCRRHQSQFYPYACCTYTPAIIVRTKPVFLVIAARHFAAADESCPGHTYTWQYLAKATSPPTPCCNEELAGNAFSHMPVMSDCAIAGQLPAALSAVFRSAMVFISPQVLTHGECLVGRPAFHTA